MSQDLKFIFKEEFVYKGESKGLVGDCGFCEHCGDLPKKTKWFYLDGTYWCIDCINCNGDVYYDPMSDAIFDDVYKAKWNENVICLGEL